MGNRAVVVGGGIGGLATAIGLRRIGWEVTVLERAQLLDDAGAGISLHANGIRALDVLGVGAAVRAAAHPQYTGATRTPRGSRLARMDGRALERALGTPIVGIPRSVLHQLLRDALPPECLSVGAEAVSVDRADPRRPRVRLKQGDLDADLVVGADGLHSRLRTELFPDHPGPAYSGSTVLRAVTEGPVALDADFELTWGPGAEFGHIAFADGRAEWHAVLNSPARTRFADPLTEVRRRCGGWHAPIPSLLAATRPEAVLHHDIDELVVPLPAYTAGRVALLGDAAHAMTPNLGQGACQALEDAAVLTAALSAESTVEGALARYDTERRPRSQAVARAARQAGRMGQQLTHPAAITVRNTAMRLAPSAVTVRTILRHARWTPPVVR
ncbi:FAD-dependent monooxygenase [Streptomyces sp. RY43-2]|uniref:FAD-dependent monooxygenase n=1 Tax=Streptomyces macrolidinus TaxID=2952607 RepID=A0ABT0ZJE3_9ACTN|nr:FAD-dependent monooxygenase [Streptomyces macrolidinus]MCN9243681.1 FAD-dependent monooxygenase [Streptomyces macrolidinus]